MLRNLAFLSLSILLFFAGMVLYGMVLNLREDTLAEAMAEKNITSLNDVRLIVSREDYNMKLYSDTVLVKTYRVVFGQGTGRVKTSRFDNVTPRGNYKICKIDTNSEYHKKLFLNYPNPKDAAEALKNGTISNNEFEILTKANTQCPPQSTRLGADIGIHGIGEYDLIFRNLPFVFNWTNGSIAVSNSEIDELHSVVKIDTEVVIGD